MRYFVKFILLGTALLMTSTLSAQKVYADKVVAVVGNSAILYSEVADRASQIVEERREINYTPERSAENQALEDLLLQKLLYNQAQIDSVSIDNYMSQIGEYVENQVSGMIAKAGSLKELERQQHRQTYEIKDELRGKIEEYYYAQAMMHSVTENEAVTPGEVERTFKKMKKDDLPIIPEQYVYAQITRYPKSSEGAKQRTKERLLEIRERILNGARFDLMARMYSVDPGTALRGGELPPFTKEQFVQPFVDAVSKLQPGQMSGVVETEYGFHLIQLISHEGDTYMARHILLKPVFADSELQQTLEVLDSVVSAIRDGRATFAEAALRESDDAGSRLNNGIVTNLDLMRSRGQFDPSAATTKFPKDQIDPNDYKVLSTLKIGEISAPYIAFDRRGDQWGKVITPVEIIPSHTADIKTDYLALEQISLSEKKQKKFDDWLDGKIATMYVRIDPSFDLSQFDRKAWAARK